MVRQGASSKRANGDFPSRGWKILIGWQESGSTKYGRWRALAPSQLLRINLTVFLR